MWDVMQGLSEEDEMSRDRSGLAVVSPEPPKPGCSPDEVACRRQKAIDARQQAELCARKSHRESNAPVFSDWRITCQADANRLCAEMIIGIEAGEAFSVRVRKV